jgi:hypothetical protein
LKKPSHCVGNFTTLDHTGENGFQEMATPHSENPLPVQLVDATPSELAFPLKFQFPEKPHF